VILRASVRQGTCTVRTLVRTLRLFLLLIAGATGCATADEEPAESDAAIADLENVLGFDGAIARLDPAALGRIEAEAAALEAENAPLREIERVVSRRVLVEGARRTTVRPATLRVSAYDADLFQLNPEERALCKAARLVCVRVLVSAAQARLASKIAYSDGDVGGRIDAFRHTYWNALMASKVGAAHAKAWGDAHETGNPFDKGTTSDRRLAEMDYFNNERGRGLAVRLGDPVLRVRTALERGELRAIRYDRGDPDGVLVPTTECTDARCGR